LKPERTASPNFAGQLSLSRTDGLAAILRDRIVKGVYRPGDRIREIELQQEFKLSNGPVREALQRLVADGILDRSPWRGVRVAELGKKEIIELFQLRVALLEYAVQGEEGRSRLDECGTHRVDPARRRQQPDVPSVGEDAPAIAHLCL
jgi:DNA-binding GntR family transcriptional regulator